MGFGIITMKLSSLSKLNQNEVSVHLKIFGTEVDIERLTVY
jgi:hypothetical protein